MSETELPLRTLQTWMHQALMLPQQTSHAEIEAIVEPSPRLSGAQCLAIYQRSYQSRLLKCMIEQFPALCHALGEELFTDFAREYLQACPPESYTLYDLGRRFANHLEDTRPDRGQSAERRESWIDFMVDLARFERQLFVLFDAPGHEERSLADESTPDERLRLQAGFALGDYRFPVAWYYHEVRKQAEPKFPPPQRSLVAQVRKDFLTHTVPLGDAHHIFLTALAGGNGVADSLLAVAERTAVPVDQLHQSWIAPGGVRTRWIAYGFFVDAEQASG